MPQRRKSFFYHMKEDEEQQRSESNDAAETLRQPDQLQINRNRDLGQTELPLSSRPVKLLPTGNESNNLAQQQTLTLQNLQFKGFLLSNRNASNCGNNFTQSQVLMFENNDLSDRQEWHQQSGMRVGVIAMKAEEQLKARAVKAIGRKPSYIQNKKFDYITAKMSTVKRMSAGHLYDNKGAPVLMHVQRSPSITIIEKQRQNSKIEIPTHAIGGINDTNINSLKPLSNAQELLKQHKLNSDNKNLIKIASNSNDRKDSGAISEIQKQINQVMRQTHRPSQVSNALPEQTHQQQSGSVVHSNKQLVKMGQGSPGYFMKVIGQNDQNTNLPITFQKSLQSIVIHPDDNLQQIKKPQNNQITTKHGNEPQIKNQITEIQPKSCSEVNINVDPAINGLIGSMDPNLQMQRQLQYSSQVYISEGQHETNTHGMQVLKPTHMENAVPSNDIQNYNDAVQMQQHQLSQPLVVMNTENHSGMIQKTDNISTNQLKNVDQSTQIINPQCTSQNQAQMTNLIRNPSVYKLSSSNLPNYQYQHSLGPGMNLHLDDFHKTRHGVIPDASQTSGVHVGIPSLSIAEQSINSICVPNYDSNTRQPTNHRRNQSQEDKRSPNDKGETTKLIGSKCINEHRDQKVGRHHIQIEETDQRSLQIQSKATKDKGVKWNKCEPKDAEGETEEKHSQKTDSIWNQEMFDSIFSEKPKYFKHTPSKKMSVKSSQDSMSNRNFSVSSNYNRSSPRKHEKATAKAHQRKKSQFIKYMQEELNSDEMAEENEEHDDRLKIGSKRTFNDYQNNQNVLVSSCNHQKAGNLISDQNMEPILEQKYQRIQINSSQELNQQQLNLPIQNQSANSVRQLSQNHCMKSINQQLTKQQETVAVDTKNDHQISVIQNLIAQEPVDTVVEKPKKTRNRKKRMVTNCPHVHLPHYAKGMCNHCYHIRGRNVLANKCEHTDRKMYCKGLCQNCYFNSYNSLKKGTK